MSEAAYLLVLNHLIFTHKYFGKLYEKIFGLESQHDVKNRFWFQCPFCCSFFKLKLTTNFDYWLLKELKQKLTTDGMGLWLSKIYTYGHFRKSKSLIWLRLNFDETLHFVLFCEIILINNFYVRRPTNFGVISNYDFFSL